MTLARSAYSGLVGVVPAHARGTTAAGLAHGGTWVVSSGSDGVVQAWDVVANREVWHAQVARLTSVSPDGGSVIGVDATGRLAVISVADGKVLHEWHPDPGASTDIAGVLAWAPDSIHFAAATPNGRVFLGAATSSTLAAVDPHKATVWSVTFSPDGTRVATAGDDGITMIRETATGATLARLTDGPSQVASIAWIDGGRIVTGDDKGIVRVWNLAEHRVVRRFSYPGGIYGVILGATEPRWLAAYGAGTTAFVWDLETGAVLQKLPGHTIGSDVAARVGDFLVTTDETGNTFVWDPRTGEHLQTLPNEGFITSATASKDRVVLAGNGRMRVWQIAPERSLARDTHHTARIRDLTWSADGRTLWSASNDGTAVGLELATGSTITFGESGGFSEPPLAEVPAKPPAPNPHGLRSFRLSPDGTRLATANEDGTLALWNLAKPSDEPTRFLGHTGRVRRVEFSRDGRSIYSVGDTTLRAWDLATGKQRASVDLGASGWDLALLHNDEVIATQAETKPNRVVMWRASDLTPVSKGDLTTNFNELPAADDRVVLGGLSELDTLLATGKLGERIAFTDARTAALLPSGRAHHVVVGGAAGELALYDWPSLHPVRSWQTGGFITTARLRPDEAILATVGGRKVALWDPATGHLLTELELPVLLIGLAWSPDGTHLAFAGSSGTVWIWDLTPSDTRGLAAYVRCASPWQLEDTSIVAAPFDPASCSVLAR
jgi:WD40 repeat protein